MDEAETTSLDGKGTQRKKGKKEGQSFRKIVKVSQTVSSTSVSSLILSKEDVPGVVYRCAFWPQAGNSHLLQIESSFE